MNKKLFLTPTLLVLFSFALVLLCTNAAAQTKETHPFVERDSTLYLDVHKPAIQRADKAAVLAVFGGGFFTGKRDDRYQSALADSLVERGFTVISIDYRLGMKDSLMVAENSKLLKIHTTESKTQPCPLVLSDLTKCYCPYSAKESKTLMLTSSV